MTFVNVGGGGWSVGSGVYSGWVFDAVFFLHTGRVLAGLIAGTGYVDPEVVI